MDYKNTEICGPFNVNYVAVDGYEVPKLEATIHSGDQDGECRKWASLIAHAMAIGAGYSCHGENSTKMNPFKIQLRKLQ